MRSFFVLLVGLAFIAGTKWPTPAPRSPHDHNHETVHELLPGALRAMRAELDDIDGRATWAHDAAERALDDHTIPEWGHTLRTHIQSTVDHTCRHKRLGLGRDSTKCIPASVGWPGWPDEWDRCEWGAGPGCNLSP